MQQGGHKYIYIYIYVTNPAYERPSTHHQSSPAHHMDSCTTQTVTCHSGLQFPSPIALISHAQLNALITRSPRAITHTIYDQV